MVGKLLLKKIHIQAQKRSCNSTWRGKFSLTHLLNATKGGGYMIREDAFPYHIKQRTILGFSSWGSYQCPCSNYSFKLGCILEFFHNN